jgi:hypothetical protein
MNFVVPYLPAQESDVGIPCSPPELTTSGSLPRSWSSTLPVSSLENYEAALLRFLSRCLAIRQGRS